LRLNNRLQAEMAKTLQEFQVFAKPIGSLCNLECRYCYYVNKQLSAAGVETLRMPDSLLEEYIVQHIEASPGTTIAFSWHGGEPTLLGLDYFRKIVALQRKHQPRNKQILNGMQTNGILLDEEWCRFLSSERFGVGLSLDGPAKLHDAYRVTRGGEPTHKLVMRAFEYLKRGGITCDILCAVHDQNALHPLQVYQYFKEIGGRYLGFLPVVERLPGSDSEAAPYSAAADSFGEFLCTIFDEWSQRDIGRVSVQIFEEAIRPLQGSEHSLCIFRKTCGNIPVIERNGDFFCCDHFVDEKHRLGNILETPFPELLQSREQKAFGETKRNTLPRYCLQCSVLDMCNGGCPKDRFLLTPEGEPGLNYLCRGYKHLFTHCRPFFLKVVAASRTRPKSESSPGRNDPCPCGSGKKHKKCCMGKKQETAGRILNEDSKIC
jgi:uncharacterized protein